MANKQIKIARDFSRFPAGRFNADGPFSGECFRDRFLEPALKQRQRISIDFDGCAGFGSSFLDEAFGGIVRKLHLTQSDVKNLIELKSEDESLLAEVKEYLAAAAEQ